MTLFTMFVYLLFLTTLKGQEIDTDLKAEFKALSTRFTVLSNSFDQEQMKVLNLSKQIEEKDNDIKLLDERISSLEKLNSKLQNLVQGTYPNTDMEEVIQQSRPTLANKTLEQRVEALEEMAKLNTLRSCDELASYGISTSGIYQIDPDGEKIGDAPIEVFCNFTIAM